MVKNRLKRFGSLIPHFSREHLWLGNCERLPYPTTEASLKSLLLSMGVDWCLPLMSYGDVSKVHRRLLHQFLNTNEAKKLDKFLYMSIHEFLHRLAEDPKGFFGHVKLCVMSSGL